MPENNEIAPNTIDFCECDDRNPLERDGTSQAQRLLAGLLPSSVAVDERKLEDLLLLAARMAEKLKFFGNDNKPDGDWKNFITHDVTTLVAEIATLDLTEERKAMQQLVEKIDRAVKDDPDHEVKSGELQPLFDNSIKLLEMMSGWYERTDERLQLHRDIDLVFKSVFTGNLKRLAGIDKSASEILTEPFDFEIADIESFLHSDWIEHLSKETDGVNGDIDWENEERVPNLDEVFMVDGDENQKLRSAARYMHGLYEQQVNAVLGITKKRAIYLDETLNNYPYHKAHVGLFIAFLQVFGYAQQHMNGLTGKHLDYYYERILGLKRREAVPDKAHVIFELAKNVSEFLVPEKTKLNAGKDAKGAQVAFATCDDIIVNKAQAALFKNVVIDAKDDEYYGLFAADKADSSDGKGGELDSKVPQWNAFGESQYGKMPLKRTLPEARIGFAIASPQLILNEGTRTITLTFNLKGMDGIDVNLFKEQFERNKKTSLKFLLSGAKGWFEPNRIVSVDFETKDWNDGGTGWFKKPDINPGIFGFPAGFDPLVFPGPNNLFPAGIYFDVFKPVVLPESASTEKKYELKLVIQLDETQEAIVPYDAALHGGTFSTEYPMLALLLPNFPDTKITKPGEDATDAEKESYADLETKTIQNFYELFKTLTIRGGKIHVKVSGVKNIIVQNDLAKLDPNKPFQPFGVMPSSGSNFYIGSPEIFYKKLRKLTLHIDWHELPADFKSLYDIYGKALGWALAANSQTEYATPTGINSAADFSAQVEYLIDRQWKKLAEYKIRREQQADITRTSFKLFGPDTANSNAYTLEPADNDDRDNWISGGSRVTDIVPISEYKNDVQRGFIRFVLNEPDFKHRDYPAVLTKVAFDSSSNGTLKGQVVKPPYTPIIKAISIDYESEQQLKQSVDRLFHLHPFGEAEVSVDPSLSVKLLPQFTLFEIVEDQVSGKKTPKEILNEETLQPAEQQSMFFIGLENAKPGSSISMLVQVVEDSGDPAAELPTINWSYLLGNRWIKLEPSQVVSDTTNGFITSGIVEIALPADATNNNTILPSGYHWLCASVETDYEALCNILAIKTQAICAEFSDNGNDPNRLSEALEAGKIAKLLDSLPQVKSVKQPYASFGGRMAEQNNEFYRRVSERLRHKGRAIAIWDYERLVLEHFTSVYKVKCINHTSNDCGSELVPGSVCITVVSNLRNQNQVDKFRPTTSVSTLQEIKKFLKLRTSRFVNLEVINPRFEALRVGFKVAFGKEFAADSGYYQSLLEEEIKRYLSPWAYDGAHDITFGGKIHGSSIIDFVEERHYVEYIKDFQLYTYDDDTKAAGAPAEEVSASTASSILVSAKTHDIQMI